MQQHVHYDLFVSYASADDHWVRGYLLPALGLPPEQVITRDDFRPGAPIPDEFARAVLSSRYTVLVLSAAYVADGWLKYSENLAAYLGVEAGQLRLIPLRRDAFEPPTHIKFLEMLDCTSEPKWASAVQRLLAVLGQSEPQTQYLPCPYPGMAPFTASNAQYFYGRDAEIRQMIQHLRQHRRMFVIGPSGSGKSSLVFAGLLPQLSSGKYFPKHFWEVRSMRPGAQPTQTLLALLADQVAQQAAPRAVAIADHAALAQQRLLIVIDQFEEVFTQSDRTEQTRFMNTLNESLARIKDCALLITLRADFYSALMESKFWPDDPSQRFDVVPLRGEALRCAITQPALDVGVYLERDLVERLIADADEEPGSLPLIQETMQMLWGERQQRLLTLKAYERLSRDGRNGLAVAVATKADATFGQLSKAQQAIARRIFLCLVQFGEGCPDTRRQQPLDELRSPHDDPRDFDMTLERLTANGLLITGEDKRTRRAVVDISHEVLIGGWPRFQHWLNEDRMAELLRRRLEHDADEWRRKGCDPSFLYGGGRLAEAHRYAEEHQDDVSQDLVEFLAASTAHEAELKRSQYLFERSRYWNVMASGAVGTALGYALAFTMLLLPKSRDITIVLGNFLVFLPFGALVGLCIGLGLWLWRPLPTLRSALTSLIGMIVGGALYMLFIAVTSEQAIGPNQIVAGAIWSACIGVGVGLDRHLRLVGTALGGVAGAVLAYILHGLPQGADVGIFSVALVGLVLGGLTGLGFHVAAMEERQPATA